MKINSRSLSLLFAGVLAAGGSALAQSASQSPTVVIPRVPVQDGSNASRAPFIPQRQFDDVKAPDGKAIDDNVPPNTPATDEPAPPPATVAILQPRVESTIVTTEPQLAMTGRPTVGVAAGLNSTQVVTTIRTQEIASRDQLLADIDARLKTSESAVRSYRDSSREMSADNRAQFKTMSDDLAAKEKALRKSVQAARKASATEWDAARTQLAADYEAYAAAAAQLDTTAGLPPVQR